MNFASLDILSRLIGGTVLQRFSASSHWSRSPTRMDSTGLSARPGAEILCVPGKDFASSQPQTADGRPVTSLADVINFGREIQCAVAVGGRGLPAGGGGALVQADSTIRD
jgi:hypothetical protein